MKRIISLLLAFAIILAMAPNSMISVHAETASALTVELTNSKLLTPEGEEIPVPIDCEVGDQLVFKVAPLEGCELESMKIGSIFIVPDTEDTFSVTVKEGMTITVTARDVTAPVILAAERQEEGLYKQATYFVTVEENVGIVAAVLQAEGSDPVELTVNEDGSYSVVVTENGTYTVTVTDAAGLSHSATITESQIEKAAPEIKKLERQEDGWAKTATYILVAEDKDAGLDKVTLQKAGDEFETQLEAEEDGSYQFILDSRDTYTVKVYDNAGNTFSQEITDDLIDGEAPQIQTPVRSAEGWQTQSVTYSFGLMGAGNKSMGGQSGSGQQGGLMGLSNKAVSAFEKFSPVGALGAGLRNSAGAVGKTLSDSFQVGKDAAAGTSGPLSAKFSAGMKAGTQNAKAQIGENLRQAAHTTADESLWARGGLSLTNGYKNLDDASADALHNNSEMPSEVLGDIANHATDADRALKNL